METTEPRICQLYLITPPQIELAGFTEKVKQAFGGGKVGCLQLRLKGASDDEILKTAEALLPICQAHEAAFIMNDRADLALKAGANGVHLGQDDGDVTKIRKLLGPERIIGVSCHDSRHLAMEAGEQGADYVAFGTFHPTTSKSPEALAKYGTPNIEILEWWQETTVLPCVAIGGMNPSNCGRFAAAGADFIAVIQAVWNDPKGPAHAVDAFNRSIMEALEKR